MPKKVCEIDACSGCPFRAKFPDNTFVAPRVGSNLRLAIGEAPGKQEAEEGKPFVGGAGKWLQVIYGKAGLKETDNSVVNVINCRPPNNVFPTDSQARDYITDAEAHQTVEHCLKAHTLPFLKSRPWKRIDVFGDKPLKFVLEKGGGITNWRGSVLPVPALDNARIAVPTFHPAYLARDQVMLPVAINDLRKTLEIEPEYYSIFPSLEQVKRFTATKFAFDIETDRWTQEIKMVGLSDESFHAIVVPFLGPYIDELIRIFANATEVIGQNCIQFDLPILADNGIFIRGPKECQVWDIMLMHHLRFPSFPHDLEFIGKQFTNKGAWKADKVSYETYCARDVDVTFRCFEPLEYLLKQADVLRVYKYISWPLALICKYMKDRGVYLSGSAVLKLREDYAKQIADTELVLPEGLRSYYVTKRKRVKAPDGTVNDKGKPLKYVFEDYQEKEVPWKSPKIKQEFLYETLGLPVQYHIKSKKITVDKGALDKLYVRHKNPELKALKDLNKWATLLASFAKEDLTKQDVLHPSFNVHGTETGRLSSSGPNIQNQPESVRFMFVSRHKDGKIVSVDYSGIENRITAYLANDKRRAQWLSDPSFSEHKYLASKMEGIPYEEVQKSKDKDSAYAQAKIVVHGSDRMMGAEKIARQFDLDIKEVKKFQYTWKSEIADTIRWQQRVSGDISRVGWEANPFGRKWWGWGSGIATKAVSFFAQSAAFDVIARAMIGLMYETIGWPLEWAKLVTPICQPLPKGATLFIQVHDELVVDCIPEVVDETIATLRKVMTQPWSELGNMSLPIGVGVGNSWGELLDE